MKISNNKATKHSKFLKLWAIPIKILAKAQSFYMKTLEDCADLASNGGSFSIPFAQVSSVSVKRSSYSEKDESMEILRAAARKQMEKTGTRAAIRGVRRSYSVGVGKMGRIDEEKPCAFEEDDDVIMFYHRSRTSFVKYYI